MKKYYTFFLACSLFLSFFGCERAEVNASHIRIVTTYQPATYMVFALQKQNHIVGINQNADAFLLFSRLLPRIKEIPVVGDKSKGINLETLVGTSPTLVVLFPGANSAETAKKLSTFGIATEFLQSESMEELQASMLSLGKILDAQEQARKTCDEMKRVMALPKLHFKKDRPKARVYFSSSRDLLTTHSRKMLQHDMIESAMAEDVSTIAEGGWATISAEQLLAWNPEVIIVSAGAQYPLDFEKDARFREIEAVKKGRVHQMPDGKISYWDYPGPNAAIGVLWIAKVCYPDLFKELDWPSEMDRYYRNVYGISRTQLNGKPK